MHLKNMPFLNPAYVAAFLFALSISALFNGFLNFNIIPYSSKICSYHSNIGQDWLNVALTM